MKKTIDLRLKLDDKLLEKIRKNGCKRGAKMALDHLASVSKMEVPLDLGPLKNSCQVEVNEDGTEGTVSYDTPYAVIQHENMSFRHQRGRKAKYLEDPVHDVGVNAQMLELLKRGIASEIK